MGLIFGQPKKPGKARRPQEVPGTGTGPASPGNAVQAAGIRFGSNPLAFSFAHRLGIMSSLTSPAVRGRFRGLDSADPTRRGGGTPDLGALQTFRGLAGLTGRFRAGMQAGPSQQPGYPSTGTGGVIPQLAAMSRPDVQPIGGF